MLGGKKTPRARPQERARAGDAKPNASKPPTQAAGGAPRPRRKGAKATRQPVTRTHGRARPAAKPTRPTTERRPAGAGATAPHHARQRRRDHASGRRNGGEAGGDGAGRAALGRDCWPPTPLPSAQSAPLSRRSSAADADGSDEHGAQNGGTAAGRGEPKGAEQTPLPRAQSGARPSGRATGQATGRKADGRDGAAGEFGRLCASVAVFSACGGQFCLSSAKNARKGEKTQILGLTCVEHGFILGMGV